jgi:hypothetical protein
MYFSQQSTFPVSIPLKGLSGELQRNSKVATIDRSLFRLLNAAALDFNSNIICTVYIHANNTKIRNIQSRCNTIA